MAGKSSDVPGRERDRGSDEGAGRSGMGGAGGAPGPEGTPPSTRPQTRPQTQAQAPARVPSQVRELRRRRLAAAAWVCAVAAAFLLGAWSFSHADPGGQYARHEPIDEAGVHRELTQAEQRARTRSPDSPESTSPAPGASDSSGAPEATDKGAHGDKGAGGDSGGKGQPGADRTGATAHTSTVRFPDGLGTAVAECRRDTTTVELLSWSPAEGYSADDVDAGPAAEAGVELEPVDDDADDRAVLVRCVDGKPRATEQSESAGDAEDAAED